MRLKSLDIFKLNFLCQSLCVLLVTVQSSITYLSNRMFLNTDRQNRFTSIVYNTIAKTLYIQTSLRKPHINSFSQSNKIVLQVEITTSEVGKTLELENLLHTINEIDMTSLTMHVVFIWTIFSGWNIKLWRSMAYLHVIGAVALAEIISLYIHAHVVVFCCC